MSSIKNQLNCDSIREILETSIREDAQFLSELSEIGPVSKDIENEYKARIKANRNKLKKLA